MKRDARNADLTTNNIAFQSPQKKSQIEIVPYFNVSNTGEQFICYDNEREDRIITFATRQSLLLLQNKKDGSWCT